MKRWLAMTGMSVALAALAATGARAGRETDEFAALLARSGIRGGFAVHVGATDGRMEETLRQDGRFLVHGLTDDAEAVAVARRHLGATGFYGQVSVEWRNDLERLPYAANLVNLIVADLDRLGKRAPEPAELERALAPLGALILKRDGQWRLTRKPWPETMGEWTHPWGDAGNNPVSQDTEMGVPTGIRWIVGPEVPMGLRKSSNYGFLSAGGRVFYLSQNTAENLDVVWEPPFDRYVRPYYIVARDAFNGVFLWKHPYEGPGLGQSSVNRRIVATSNRLFVVTGDRLLALDAATGEKQAVYPTENVSSQLLFHEGRLLAACFNAVTAYDPDTAEILWRAETGYPVVRRGQNILSVAAHGDGLYVLIRGEGRDGWFTQTPHEIWSLAVQDGRERWRCRLEGDREESPGIYRPHMTIGMVGDGFFGLIAQNAFHVLGTADGAALWSREVAVQPGKGYVAQQSVGHVYNKREGVIWLRTEAGRNTPEGRAIREGVWLAVDPMTGEERRRITGAMSPGCGRMTATLTYGVSGRNNRVFDFDDGQEHNFHMARNACGIGMIPANGLLYTAPHACVCNSHWARGYMALDAAPVPSLEETEAAPLQKGPRFGTYDQSVAPLDEGWPSYRANALRSATTPQALPDKLEPLWTTPVSVGEPERSDREWALLARSVLTAPVAANGRVYLADPRGHRVVALAADSGEQAWEYIADGRVDSPPTVHGPLVLFGSHDGRVTCLDAATGELVWRRRVAPGSERVMAHGQLASRWPVSGSVLVQDGMAFAAAGHTAQGGVFTTALDVWTGEVRWRTRLESGVGLSDILVSDGDSLFLMQTSIDPATGAVETAHGSGRYLRNQSVGLLFASWTRLLKGKRSGMHWMTYGGVGRQSWPTLMLLAFDGDAVWGYDAPRGRQSYDRQRRVFAKGVRGADDVATWEFEIQAPRQVEALIRAGQSVLAAGPHDYRTAPNTKGFLLRLAADGRLLQEIDMASPPVYEGMAAADQRLYVATQDGRLHAFGSR